MSDSGRRDQISRLFQILFAMRAGHPNASDLAALCEVSPRTIYRDLAALEQAGVPIQYRTDAQGYEISPKFTLPVPNLSRTEAASLVAAARIASEGNSFLARDNQTAIGKILSTLCPADRLAVETLGRLLVPDEDGDDARTPPAASGVSTALFEALSTGRRVHAWFEEGYEGESCRVLREESIGIYRLVRMRRDWHLIGRLEGEDASTITLSLRALQRIELTNHLFEMPDDAEVVRLLGMAGLGHPVPPSGILVRLRAEIRLAAHFRGAVWHPTRRHYGGGEDWRELTLVVDRVDAFLRSLLKLGAGIELLAPPYLVTRLMELSGHVSVPEPHPSRISAASR